MLRILLRNVRITGGLIVRLLASAIIARSGAGADYYVDSTGANGAFTSVGAALDAVSDETELNRANIFIAPGIYRERLQVSKPFVSLIGLGPAPDAVTISYSVQEAIAATTIEASALAFMARNLTFENSTPDRNTGGAQAVQSSADRAVFDNVRFVGYQDTLFVNNTSRQYFHASFVTGDSDFIFGDATAVFDGCTIQSTDFGWITAADTQRTTANGLIFLDCVLTAASDATQPGGDNSAPGRNSVYLGRPWMWWENDIMPSVTFIRTRMGPHINAQGWDPWDYTGVPGVDPSRNRDPLTRFSEFGSMDLNGNPLRDSNRDGAPDGRVSWADRMTADEAANYTLEQIFGPAEFWNASTQPDVGSLPYHSQGAPWDVKGQLALLPVTSGGPSRPLNMSTRLLVQHGENAAITGFILRGSESKSVVIRALGPSLADAGIEDALSNPTLALRAADGSLVRYNGNWKYSQEAAIEMTGLAPENELESAIVATLAPGAYTAIVKGYHNVTGVALGEIYDIDDTADAALVNISTRGFVGSGDDVMIAGFILGGGEGTAKVLIRGIGPSLAQAGIAQPLANPTLTLRNSDGALIAFNDDWQDSQEAEIEATGIPPSDSRESAIVVTLPAGSYTAELAGGADVGVGLVEVYALE